MSVEGASSSSEAWLAGSEAWLAVSTSTAAAADALGGGPSALETVVEPQMVLCTAPSQPYLDLPAPSPSQEHHFWLWRQGLNPQPCVLPGSVNSYKPVLLEEGPMIEKNGHHIALYNSLWTFFLY